MNPTSSIYNRNLQHIALMALMPPMIQRYKKIIACFFFLFTLLFCHFAQGQGEAKTRVGIVEKLGNVLPLDVVLKEENGQDVVLKNLVSKPTIVTFVYYRCTAICNPWLGEISKVLEMVEMEPGKDFDILSVSFNPQDDPSTASEKKANYLQAMQRRIPPESWRFLTGKEEQIRKLTDAAGFYYEPDGKGGYRHVGALIVLSPEGKIIRYITGKAFLPPDIEMAVEEARVGKETPSIPKILQYCYSYDPESRKYSFDFKRVGAVLTLVSISAFALLLLRKGKPAK